ncbi:hypothetical protein BC835DRAFT_1403626 [Cytidiella melzeri]|nr:hypothetical protein BC835DRAFT_1403626 [Cytidiella melzeri]
MTALYAQKLAIEGASPKPCIVPGNALQLIDDNPAASRSHTPSSVIILDDDVHPPEHSLDSSADQGDHPAPRPVPRVRFRSRVRITSGLRRSKHIGNPTSSPSSSASGSPSSSISAPIRWQADENGAWGPLGRRLNAYAQAHGRSKRSPAVLRAQQPLARAKMDERTPLVKPGRHVAYVDSGLDGGGDADDERAIDGEESEDEGVEGDSALRAAALKREEDATFGKWPWRLLNRHWWWWHAEPVLCVCCAEDSEYENH